MTSIDESLTARGYTPAASVPAVFGRARTIDGAVIHHWGERGQTHDGVVNFFVNGPGSTSAHFVVSAGRIHCLVNPADAAWHSGNAVGNATTIGIECRPEATDGDYATVAELVRYLRGQYGALPLSPHRNWQSTACPGVWDLDRIDTLAGGIAAQGTITPSTEVEEDMASAEWFGAVIQAVGRIEEKVNKIGDRVFGRDVQRWYSPQTLEVRTEPFAGSIAARSADVHDFISTNRLIESFANKTLDAVSKVQGVDPSVISGLREELAAELKSVTENLSVTLTVAKES